MDAEQNMIHYLSHQIAKAEDERVMKHIFVSSIVKLAREGNLENLPLTAAMGGLDAFAAKHILEFGLDDFLEKYPEYAHDHT
jgi:hypothetical protein